MLCELRKRNTQNYIYKFEVVKHNFGDVFIIVNSNVMYGREKCVRDESGESSEVQEKKFVQSE